MSDKKIILVIGAAHIDILANYKSEDCGYLDKPAEISYRPGGTALNVSINLARKHKNSTYILTAINPKKIISKIIRKEFKKHGIQDQYSIFNKKLSDGLFIGILKNRVITDAVTQTGIENLNELTELNKKLDRAIVKEKTSIVIVDCNLHSIHIKEIIKKCHQINEKMPVIFNGVSEYKTKRLKRVFDLDVPNNYQIYLASLNMSEFNSLLEEHCTGGNNLKELLKEGQEELEKPVFWSKETVEKICKAIRIKNLIITQGRLGYIILTSKGKKEKVPGTNNIKNNPEIIGAGDALIAGVGSYLFNKNITFDEEIDWEECKPIIQEYLEAFFNKNNNTSSNGFSDIKFMEGIFTKNYSLIKWVLLFFIFALSATFVILLHLGNLPIIFFVILILVSMLMTLLISEFISEDSFINLFEQLMNIIKNNENK